MSSLDALLAPSSIAIIGASDDPARVGGRPIKRLLDAEYKGAIYPINPKRDRIQGLPAYASIRDVPGPVDCAIVAVPSTIVIDTIRDCAATGVRCVVLFNAGFAEMGEAGKKAQDTLTRIARESGMRILGPNCIGAYSTKSGAYATFMSPFVKEFDREHNIGLVSQSGGVGSHLTELALRRGLAVGMCVTTGNECDIELADVMESFAADPDVRVIATYIEGVRNPERFCRALALAQRNRKPVVVLKVGRSDHGATVAASHTASLAGSATGYDAILRKYNAIQVSDIDEMLDLTYFLSRAAPPPDRNLGVISLSGGAAVLSADLCERANIHLPQFPPEMQARIREIAPFASLHNPSDTTANVVNQPEIFLNCLRVLADSGLFQTVLAFLTVSLSGKTGEFILAALQAVRAEHPEFLFIAVGLGKPEEMVRFEKAGAVVFEEMSRAINALSKSATYSEGLNRPEEAEGALPQDLPVLNPGRTYNEAEAKALLDRIGIPAPAELVAPSPAEAVARAGEVGFPMALKVVSADILHKSDVGGVALGLCDAAELDAALARMQASVTAVKPEARIEGYLLSQMAPKGVECILGIVRDPKFGPLVMFGLGGVAVEVFRDVTYRAAPVDLAGAKDMIRNIRSRSLLMGHRGTPPTDVEALARAIVGISQLAASNADTITSAEINPLLVLPEGQGVLALDALIETSGS